MRAPRGELSRRALLGGTGLAALGATLAACAAEPPEDPAVDATGRRVPATGEHQAGIVTPHVAQRHLTVAVHDLAGDPGAVLAALGETILDLASGSHAALSGIEPGDLTVTVGVGPSIVAARGADLPGATPLPSFPGERLPERADGGDLLLQVCASDGLVVPLALAALEAQLGAASTLRWRQRAVRGPHVAVDEGVPIAQTIAAPRNVLGFVDGIVAPRTRAELDAEVWLPEPTAVAGGTIAVVRRMELDVAAFQRLGLREQEAVIGRTRADSAPLSGGTIADDVDLQAKAPDGSYLLPVDAHARRAHARTVGVSRMLRRSYSMEEPLGLLFVGFQRELRAFTAVMERMSDSDALLERTTTTATGTFLILPGFDRDRPLGTTLLA